MELNKQVCSLDLAKRLKELGVKQDSLFVWYYIDGPSITTQPELAYTGQDLPSEASSIYAAFTVAELGEMLPTSRGFSILVTSKCRLSKSKVVWKCYYLHLEEHTEIDLQTGDTEADARAKCLIYLLENKLITL